MEEKGGESLRYMRKVRIRLKEVSKVKRLSSKQAKACDISKKVKDIVWERDRRRCIICGSPIAMPNAHYISRAKGGLGIEQNIVTLCSNFSENKCHYKYDFGTAEERAEIKDKIKNYLKSQYLDWNEDKLVYKKGEYI